MGAARSSTLAGSASTGAKTISAAPRQGESSPNADARMMTSLRGGHQGPAVEGLVDDVLAGLPQRGQRATEHDHLGVEHVDDGAQPDAEPVADLVQGAPGPLVTVVRGGDHLVDPLGSAAGESSGQHQQLVLADLGLPAADVAAPALLRAAAVDQQVPDLAGVAARPRERDAADQEPAADADAAVEVRHVGVPDRGAAQVLGEHAEVRVVVGEHAPPEPLREQRGERLVDPAEVRREAHRAVGVADGTRHGDAGAEAAHAGVRGEHLLDHLGRRLDDVLDVVLAGGVRALTLVEHVAPQRDQGGHDPVDADVDGHGHVVARGLEDERRPTGPSYDGRLPLGDQAQLLELGRQGPDGAAVEPEVARSARRGWSRPARAPASAAR